MRDLKILARKEVIQCKQCENKNIFFYLSDFTYGEKLVFSNVGQPIAYIKLLGNKIFEEYEKLVRLILVEKMKDINEKSLVNFINETFGIICDEVDGMKIDLSQRQNKCIKCGSTNFLTEGIQPYTIFEIEISSITFDNWKKMTFKEKYDCVKNIMIQKKYLSV